MKYGFVGLGNMATAIIKGMILSGEYLPGNILGYAPSVRADRPVARMGVTICASLAEAVAADVVVLAIKPQVMPPVLQELRSLNLAEKLIISVAAGRTLAFLRDGLGPDAAIVRVMPNINAQVGASTSAFAANSRCTDAHKIIVQALFTASGSITELPEEQFSIFSAVAGASPAFSYMYIAALARAAVRGGLPRDKALKIAASSVYGSARMVLESPEHPFALIDQVSSPDGITVEGICLLQEYGFESAVHKAVAAAALKDKNLA